MALADESAREQRREENQVRACGFLCTSLGISSTNLLTEDVTTHPEFMRALNSIASSHFKYSPLVKQWEGSASFRKSKSLVYSSVSETKIMIKKLRDELIELSDIKVVSKNLATQLQSCQQKMSKMLAMLPTFFSVKESIEKAVPLLQACIRSQKQRKFNKLTGQTMYKLFASNSLGMSWHDAMANIDDTEESGGQFFPLSAAQLKLFPSLKDACHHKGMCGIPSQLIITQYSIEVDIVKEAVFQLLEFFPLLCVRKGKQYVLLDFTEIVLYPGLVHDILTLDDKEMDTTSDVECHVDAADMTEGCFMYRKTGPVPLQKQYPELLTVMMEFIRLHGFAAHMRRREGTGTSCGVSLEDIRAHVMRNVDRLKTISRSKVYNLLKPARLNTAEAAKHKDYLDVRVGVKSCDISSEHEYAHEYFAAVRNIREMCALYPTECTIMSCDSKAKVHIGGQAVSRYHQLRNFFPNEDQPHYKDHDFPLSGYLIEPDGYLVLQATDSDTPNDTIQDKLGRDSCKLPSTGPLFNYNRCVKNSSTSIQDHVNDIHDILKKNPELKKPVLALITDGGPDWTPKSNVNEFFLGRLWRDLKLDMLVGVCNAPGLSRYNPIEHLWSPCSRWLAGVSLPDHLPGERPPPQQTDLPVEQRLEKEVKVFDNALEMLDTYWHGKIHDGFRVTSTGMTSTKTGYEKTYTDYNNVKQMFDSSLRAIEESEDLSSLRKEWCFMVKHMDRRNGLVVFRKLSCEDASCSCR